MNKLVVYTLVAFATLTLNATADARDLYLHEQPGWNPTISTPHFAAPQVIEGRNAAVVGAPVRSGVESYITQSIEQNARSSR